MSIHPHTLGELATLRLNQLLDRMGVPTHPQERAPFLASMLGIAHHQAGFLVSGEADWTLEQVALACKVFKQPLSYFLDAGVDSQLPQGVEVVTSVEGGQPIVWSCPKGLDASPRVAKSRLGYVNLDASPALLEVARRSLMVFEIWDDSKDALFWRAEEGLLYLIQTTDVRPYLCIRSTADSAVFTPAGQPDAVPLIVPVRRPHVSGSLDSSVAVLGRVIGMVATY